MQKLQNLFYIFSGADPDPNPESDLLSTPDRIAKMTENTNKKSFVEKCLKFTS
jgi:hypothetical protein